MRHDSNFVPANEQSPQTITAKRPGRPDVNDGAGPYPDAIDGYIPSSDYRATLRPNLFETALPADLVTVKNIIRSRQKRATHFDSALFADPAWDIMLSLAEAEMEQRRTTVSDLCVSAAVPATTALRWISIMTANEVLARVPDFRDRRRVFIQLSYGASLAMKSYLTDIRIGSRGPANATSDIDLR